MCAMNTCYMTLRDLRNLDIRKCDSGFIDRLIYDTNRLSKLQEMWQCITPLDTSIATLKWLHAFHC